MDQVTMQLVMIGGFMVIAYFLMIKPQKKRQKAIMDMRNNLKIGDNIVTIGGIKGKIVELTDTDVVIETSDGTKIEANANRYTFVWRGSINYHLAGLLDSIDKLYLNYGK